MRRHLVLLLSAATCATVLLASASTASPRIICPVTSGPGIVTCCGPPVLQPARQGVMPVGPCCSGSALCVIPLSISSTPNPSVASRRVTLSGRIPSSLQGATAVVLWQQLPGQQTFHQIAQRTPDASGQYTFTLTPATNREWYVTAGGLRSVTITQQVQAHVTLTVSRTSARGLVFRGQVSPSHARERVMLEMKSGGSWTVIGRARLDGHSHVRLSVSSGPRSGTFKAVLPADSRNVRSVSAPVTIH